MKDTWQVHLLKLNQQENESKQCGAQTRNSESTHVLSSISDVSPGLKVN